MKASGEGSWGVGTGREFNFDRGKGCREFEPKKDRLLVEERILVEI